MPAECRPDCQPPQLKHRYCSCRPKVVTFVYYEFSTLSCATKLEKVPHFCTKYSRDWKCSPVIFPDNIWALTSWYLSFWGCKRVLLRNQMLQFCGVFSVFQLYINFEDYIHMGPDISSTYSIYLGPYVYNVSVKKTYSKFVWVGKSTSLMQLDSVCVRGAPSLIQVLFHWPDCCTRFSSPNLPPWYKSYSIDLSETLVFPSVSSFPDTSLIPLTGLLHSFFTGLGSFPDTNLSPLTWLRHLFFRL